jgi:hypothetical protein
MGKNCPTAFKNRRIFFSQIELVFCNFKNITKLTKCTNGEDLPKIWSRWQLDLQDDDLSTG